MREELSKEYYIHERELCVLLALRGHHQLYGIRMESAETIDYKDIYQIIFAMLKKGMLTKNENLLDDDSKQNACNYSIEEKLKQCIDLIIEAKRFLVLADTDENIPEQYFYVREKDAVMLQAAVQEKVLHIKYIAEDKMQIYCRKNTLAAYYNEAAKDMYKAARECWKEDKDIILHKSMVKKLMQEYDIKTQCKTRQIIQFVRGLDEFWIISDKDADLSL